MNKELSRKMSEETETKIMMKIVFAFFEWRVERREHLCPAALHLLTGVIYYYIISQIDILCCLVYIMEQRATKSYNPLNCTSVLPPAH